MWMVTICRLSLNVTLAFVGSTVAHYRDNSGVRGGGHRGRLRGLGKKSAKVVQSGVQCERLKKGRHAVTFYLKKFNFFPHQLFKTYFFFIQNETQENNLGDISGCCILLPQISSRSRIMIYANV